MMRSLWISKSGMEAQQTQLDHISHNLANSGTNGYKRSHAVFEDLMYQSLRQSGANSSEQTQLPTGLQSGLGVRPVSTSRVFSQGNLQQTGNNMDVAIQGKGFFEVTLPDGTIVGRRLVKSSGNPAWDDAVLKAIDRTATLPRDTDGRVPASLIIGLRPQD